MTRKNLASIPTTVSLYDTNGDISTDSTDIKISQDIWQDFIKYSLYIKGKLLISYPDEEFRIQGIPAPWQVIAWLKLIKIMKIVNFSKLHFVLNYLENPDVLFENQFKKRFGTEASFKNLKLTFTCGYFWKFNPKRRENMVNLVVDEILRKGAEVNIWTQDETLEEELRGKIKEKFGDSKPEGELCVHCVPYRIDVHYTLVEDMDNPARSYLSLELIHSEAHEFRLETYLTFEELESFCNGKKFLKVLRSYQNPSSVKAWLTKWNLACNIG